MMLLYEDLSYKLRGIFFKAYNEIGPGFKEEVYIRALVKLLNEEKIPYQQEQEFPLNFHGKKIGYTKLDLVIDDSIIIEVKAVDILHTVFEKQTLSYLKATGLKLAFLVNFGNSRLEIKRFVNESSRYPRDLLRKTINEAVPKKSA